MGRRVKIETLPKDGFIQLYSHEEHERAVKAYKKSLAKEEEWRRLVQEGKATCTKVPVLNGYRYHYELIR